MSRTRILVIATALLAGGLSLAPGASGQRGEEATPGPISVFPTAPTVERLPNGLTVISVPWESPGIIAYYTLVRVGARDEVERGNSGFAHLFEHMMFRGTERFPEDVYERRIQDFGADNNAYTTQDFTLYTTTAPSSVLADLVELEADRFQRLQYDEAQFRTETGAVLGEYNKSASNPFRRMWEALSEMAFTRHTYGHTTLGYLDDIRAMPEKYEYSRRFFRRFYTPDNCTIIVAGDVDHARLVAQVRQHYGSWRGRRANPRILREPEPTAGATRHIDWEGTSPPRLLIGWRTPGFDGAARSPRARARALRETAALQVAHGLLFHESSPLYRRLVVEEAKLLELGSWSGDNSRDPHLFVTMAVLKPGEEFDPVTTTIQQAVDSLAAGPVDAARVDEVKSHVRYAFLTELETPDHVADTVAHFIAVGGDLSAMDDYLGALSAVTPEDVARVAGSYMGEGRRYVVTLAPGGAEAGGAADGGAR